MKKIKNYLYKVFVDILNDYYFAILILFPFFLLLDIPFLPRILLLLTLTSIIFKLGYTCKFINYICGKSIQELLCITLQDFQISDEETDYYNWNHRLFHQFIHHLFIFLIWIQLKLNEHPLYGIIMNMLILAQLVNNDSLIILLICFLYIISYFIFLRDSYTYYNLKIRLEGILKRKIKKKERIKATYLSSLIISYQIVQAYSRTYRTNPNPVSPLNFDWVTDYKTEGLQTTNLPFNLVLKIQKINFYEII